MDYLAHSPDHSLFAWAEDTNSAEKYTIRIKDIATGEIYPDGPESAFGAFAFSPDSQWLFWTWRDENSRPARLYRRPARGGKDVLVYAEPDPGMFMDLKLSASGRYVLIRSWGLITTEMRFIDGAAPEAAPTLVAPRREGVDYDIEHWRDRFVIRTNEDGAEDFKLMWAPVDRPHRGDWQPWVPHRPGHYITELRAFAETFVWLERIEGNVHLIAAKEDGTQREPIAFAEAAYKITVAPCEYAGNAIRLIYESPRLSRQWLSCDLATGRRETIASEIVPAVNAPDRYVLERRYATMADGATVPITILYRKGIKLDGTAPLLLTGYGSYGVTYDRRREGRAAAKANPLSRANRSSPPHWSS